MAMSESTFDLVMDVEEENLSDSICAICDNGGELICCEGKCLRSFHATEEAGIDSVCHSLRMSEKLIKDDNFTCENCRFNQHQCYVCCKLGSSDQSSAEVFQCGDRMCGYFYHPACVANSLRFKYEDEPKDGTKDGEADIASGMPFICPLHFCHACKQKEQEHETEFLLQFAVCRRCPVAFHRKCLPGGIAFEADGGEGIVTRAWEELIPNKVMIYCMKHLIDAELETPIRDHIKFPHTQLKTGEQAMESVAKVKNVPRRRLPRPSEVLERRNVSKPSQCSEKLPDSKQLHKSSSVSYRNFSGSYLFRDRKLVTKYKMASLFLGLKRKASTLDNDYSSGKKMKAPFSKMDSSGSEKQMISSKKLAGNKYSVATKLENRRSVSSEKRSKSSKEEETNKDSVVSNLENLKDSGFEKRSESVQVITLRAGNKDHVVSKLENWENSASNKRNRSKVEGNKDSLATKLQNRRCVASEKRGKTSKEEETNEDYVASKLVNPKASESVQVISLTAVNKDLVVSKLENCENFASNNRSRSNKAVEGNKDSLASKLEIPKTSGLEKQSVNVKGIASNKDHVVNKLENRESSVSKRQRTSTKEVEAHRDFDFEVSGSKYHLVRNLKNWENPAVKKQRSRSRKEVEANKDSVVSKLENPEVYSKEVEANKDSVVSKLENPEVYNKEVEAHRDFDFEVSGSKYHLVPNLKNWENPVLKKQRSRKEVEANKDSVVSKLKLENPEVYDSRNQSANKDYVVSKLKLENPEVYDSRNQSESLKEVESNKDSVVSKLKNPEIYDSRKQSGSLKEVSCNKDGVGLKLENRKTSVSEKETENIKEIASNEDEDVVVSKLKNWQTCKKVEPNKDYRDYTVRKLKNPRANGLKKQSESKDFVVSRKLKNPRANGLKKQSESNDFVVSRLEKAYGSGKRGGRVSAGSKDSVVSKLKNQESFGLEKRTKSSEACNKNSEEANLKSIDRPKKNNKEDADKSGYHENHSNGIVESPSNSGLSSFTSGMDKSTSCSKSVFRSLGFALGPYHPPLENNSVGWLTE